MPDSGEVNGLLANLCGASYQSLMSYDHSKPGEQTDTRDGMFNQCRYAWRISQR